MEISSVALQGIDQAAVHFNRAATRVASPAAADSVDLSSAAVEMLSARTQFTANLQAVKLADRMERDALDLLA